MQAHDDQKNSIGGWGPRLPDIVKMLQTTSSTKRTFICIDALDECVPEHRAKLLDSLNKILQKSPGTRIFVTGNFLLFVGLALTEGTETSTFLFSCRDSSWGFFLPQGLPPFFFFGMTAFGSLFFLKKLQSLLSKRLQSLFFFGVTAF